MVLSRFNPLNKYKWLIKIAYYVLITIQSNFPNLLNLLRIVLVSDKESVSNLDPTLVFLLITLGNVYGLGEKPGDNKKLVCFLRTPSS